MRTIEINAGGESIVLIYTAAVILAAEDMRGHLLSALHFNWHATRATAGSALALRREAQRCSVIPAGALQLEVSCLKGAENMLLNASAVFLKTTNQPFAIASGKR